MRASWCLLLAGLMLPLPGVAAPAEGPTPLLSDDEGDVAFNVETTPLDAAGHWAALDLVSLAADERPDAFLLHLSVADLRPDAEAPVLESDAYRVDFRYGTLEYRVQIYRDLLPGDDPTYYAYLGQHDEATDETTFLLPLDIAGDEASATMTATIPRDVILDQNGANPYPGTSLAGFVVRANGIRTGDAWIGLGPGGRVDLPDVGAVDLMPDDGLPGADLPVRLGIVQTGHARLASPVPVRASNGEAATFVFEVDAFNLAGDDDRFQFAVSGLPADWDVMLPVSLVDIPAHGNATLPVLVTTPFKHSHGEFDDFLVEMTSLTDPGSVGRIRLGVRYTAVPQPAGHHDTLTFHSRTFADDPLNTAFSTAIGFPLQEAYMNAAEDDGIDQDVAVPATLWGVDANPKPRLTYRWNVPLSPELAIGFDFDLARGGEARIPVGTLLPMPEATLEGVLYFVPPHDPGNFQFGGEPANATLLATLPPTAPQDIGAQGEVVLVVPVVPLPAADYVPFMPGSALVLELNLTFTRLDPFLGPHDAPALLPGGSLRLPLFEYRDAIDDVFASMGTLMLQAQGPQDAFVNPGETALFRLQLMNHADAGASFDLFISGPNAAWATLVGDARVAVSAGGVREVAVAVHVPSDAADGDVADLILQAADVDDPTVRTLARLVATVDTDGDHEDQSKGADELAGKLTGKGSPGPGFLLLACALLALALVAQRRRA
ncbi:MAG TPA: hypothetical protein VI796_06315 [Candidatus Thermoplasmatota archaeon]|nr:hypothetical protein [Candidatus Thermoplasmatota archaeon]